MRFKCFNVIRMFDNKRVLNWNRDQRFWNVVANAKREWVILCFSTRKLFIIHLFMSTFKQHICTLFYNGFYNVLTTVSVMFFGETENDLINLSHSLNALYFHICLSLFLLCSVLDFFALVLSCSVVVVLSCHVIHDFIWPGCNWLGLSLKAKPFQLYRNSVSLYFCTRGRHWKLQFWGWSTWFLNFMVV